MSILTINLIIFENSECSDSVYDPWALGFFFNYVFSSLSLFSFLGHGSCVVSAFRGGWCIPDSGWYNLQLAKRIEAVSSAMAEIKEQTGNVPSEMLEVVFIANQDSETYSILQVF